MDSSLTHLLAFFADRRAAGAPMVLATVVSTIGSTYRKPGARMLIDAAGEACGLLSGGCLETDLGEHAQAVLASGQARVIEYDLRSSDDLIWGLGLGCEGAMHILLQPLTAAQNYEPMRTVAQAAQAHRPLALAVILRSEEPSLPVGRTFTITADQPDCDIPALRQHALAALQGKAEAGRIEFDFQGQRLSAFVGALELPRRLLLLGGGPDVAPVVATAAALGWMVTVVDHRPAYAVPEHFPAAQRVVQARPQDLATRLELEQFDAAVIMSHQLLADVEYLRQLAQTDLSYIGLLGPVARRQRVLSDLGSAAVGLAGRLYGPVGLDIGARTPEAIALAIVGEIHAVLGQRTGGSFSLSCGTAAQA